MSIPHDPPRDRFEGYYAAPRVPWDIGRPQRPFVEAGDAIHGRVLDSGCGTG
ncbi:MAG: SAM-dependent methyltransferase, partial [Planctomycetota bacterium]